ncbi:MAG: restriction endonuclease [Actinomycetota bacterium]|nr:restriction endonuclease [Actinomycetota bacterium]
MTARRRRARSRRRNKFDIDAVFGLVTLVVVVGIISAARTHAVAAAVVGIVIMAAAMAGLVLRLRSRRRARWARITLARNLDRLRELTPAAFEQAVGDVLNAHGWHLSLTGGSGDEGADLAGKDPSGQRTIVQCKRYAATHGVGSPTVQLALGARTIHRAERVLVVTSSGFTAPARSLARREGIELLDGVTLVSLAQTAALDPENTSRPPRLGYDAGKREHKALLVGGIIGAALVFARRSIRRDLGTGLAVAVSLVMVAIVLSPVLILAGAVHTSRSEWRRHHSGRRLAALIASWAIGSTCLWLALVYRTDLGRSALLVPLVLTLGWTVDHRLTRHRSAPTTAYKPAPLELFPDDGRDYD